MQCEICGSVRDTLKKVKIESVSMNVCEKCERLGEPVSSFSKPKSNYASNKNFNSRLVPKNEQEKEISLKENYGMILKNKREELGIKQEALAKMLSEKESLIHKMESSNIIINMDVARKIEKILKIKILEEYSNSMGISKNESQEGFTLGDLIKKKLK